MLTLNILLNGYLLRIASGFVGAWPDDNSVGLKRMRRSRRRMPRRNGAN
jgi:hypothetical protein